MVTELASVQDVPQAPTAHLMLHSVRTYAIIARQATIKLRVVKYLVQSVRLGLLVHLARHLLLLVWLAPRAFQPSLPHSDPQVHANHAHQVIFLVLQERQLAQYALLDNMQITTFGFQDLLHACSAQQVNTAHHIVAALLYAALAAV